MRAKNHSFISLNQVYYSQYIPQFDSLLKMIERDVRKLQDLGKNERNDEWYEDR